MSRNERFPSEFQFYIETLVQLLCHHIVQRHRESPAETRSANTSLAHFIKVCNLNCWHFSGSQFIWLLIEYLLMKFYWFLHVLCLFMCFQKCFTFMDRGFVFRLVSKYLENFNPADGKVCIITHQLDVGRMLSSVCLFVCLSVYLQHNSKMNNPNMFKLGIWNDLRIP